MPKSTNLPEIPTPKLNKVKKSFIEIFKKRKKLFLGLIFILLVLGAYRFFIAPKGSANQPVAKSITVNVDKSFEFTALNNLGKPVYNKIKLTVDTAEKTSQVLVREQTFTAKNNKLFLIVNLEMKNDASIPLNLMPGDLVRLTIGDDEGNKFAPDLHNNLVAISAISTKLDRIGFVIPQEAKKFKLLIGELEGKKETVQVEFPN